MDKEKVKLFLDKHICLSTDKEISLKEQIEIEKQLYNAVEIWGGLSWIKCSDRLPDLNVDVLATTKDGGDVVIVARWRTCLEDCGWEWYLYDDVSDTRYKSDEIIAWMPLPEGFKEESDGNKDN